MINIRNMEEKLFLASMLTIQGIRKVQILATKSQTAMRYGKHVNSNDLGGKSARRKKRREKPYGKSVSNVKFWQDVRALNGSLDLYCTRNIREYEESAKRLFKDHTYELNLVKKDNTLYIYDRNEMRKYAR